MNKEKFEKGALATAKGIAILSYIFGGIPLIYGLFYLIAAVATDKYALSASNGIIMGFLGLLLSNQGTIYILVGCAIILGGLFNKYVLVGLVVIVNQNSRMVDNTDVIEAASRRMSGIGMPGLDARNMDNYN